MNFFNGLGNQTLNLAIMLSSNTVTVTFTCVSSSGMIAPTRPMTYTMDTTVSPPLFRAYQKDFGGPGIDGETDYQLQ